MQPNSGYWINVSQNCSFTYPAPVLQAPTENIQITRDCGWEPVIYPNNSATLYAKIDLDNSDENDLIGVFVGDECRGIGHIIEYNQEFFTTITMQLNENYEEFNLKYYQASNDRIFACENNFYANFGDTIGHYPDDIYLRHPVRGR